MENNLHVPLTGNSMSYRRSSDKLSLFNIDEVLQELNYCLYQCSLQWNWFHYMSFHWSFKNLWTTVSEDILYSLRPFDRKWCELACKWEASASPVGHVPKTRGKSSLLIISSLWQNNLWHRGHIGNNLVQLYTQLFEPFSKLMESLGVLLSHFFMFSVFKTQLKILLNIIPEFFSPLLHSHGLYLGLLKVLRDFWTCVKRSKNHISSRKRAQVVQHIGFVWHWTWFGGDGISCRQREIAGHTQYI